ncbi:hypothetical protein EJ419_07035 [Alloscardovia theropitheci]|uniref:Uncharacterized protein n=1 Tax=Alloscardovia theropitheci TaxID=2496842 RepID=A0A4R0QYV9_9BIFI|nr:hypothetical protein [Alloscardovia theropitheci]TCD53716.1 hypothetical protein EJ419_07035 [Alloscardovia theropitheci]
MDIQSLSGIVVITLALIIVVGIIPTKTVKSLNNATRHSEDKYSASLHVIGEPDEHLHGDAQKKSMYSDKQEAQRFSKKNVERLRNKRRAGVKRRRILVFSMFIVTCVVALAAYLYNFSYWFTLIPASIVIFLLMGGVVQSYRVRQWEKQYALYRLNKSKTEQEFLQHDWVTSFNYNLNHDFRIGEMDEDVMSREIISTRQVSAAVPPSHTVLIPSRDDETILSEDTGMKTINQVNA